MVGSVNKVIVVGNLGRDPEVRSLSDGKSMATMSLATSESWKDKASGEWRERVEWHRICVFNEHLVGVCEKHLRKGAKVYVEGSLQTRKWTDAGGVDRYATEIVLGRYRGDIQLLSASSRGEEPPPNTGEEPGVGGGDSSSSSVDDEIPF